MSMSRTMTIRGMDTLDGTVTRTVLSAIVDTSEQNMRYAVVQSTVR
jgi:hypothetical protein